MRTDGVRLVMFVACVSMTANVFAQSQPATSTVLTPEQMLAKLPPGKPVMAADAFRLQTASGYAKLDIVENADMKSGRVMRVQTIKRPDRLWEVQLSARSSSDVRNDDMLLASFRMRCVEPAGGEAHAVLVFELGKEPYSKSLEEAVTVGKEWKQFFIPFRSLRDLPAGEANINFQLGFDPQTVEIADVSVTNYGQKGRRQDLPTTPISYLEREPGASWRQAAQERIEKLRKGDLTVEVVDAQGKPLAGAEVSVKMTRHAFGVGSAVSAKVIRDQSADGKKYRDFIQRHFNKVVFDNDLKWRDWEDPARREEMIKAYDWLHSLNIEVRGHCLVWPGWERMPADVKERASDKAALAKRVGEHVTDEVSAMKGKLVEWDVVNEPFTNHDIQDILGESCMAEWFKLARAADPSVILFINDYSILSRGGLDAAHQDHYEKTIKSLLEAGAPVQGIGLQSHFLNQLTAPTKMLRILDRFGKLGLELESTEFDIDITDEQLQADFTRDFMTTLFSHPQVKGIVMWGFWEGRHWRPNGAMVRKDWSLKPNGQVWLDLVEKQWKTDVQGKSAADGTFKVRGFLGEYEITASAAGKSGTMKISLPREGAKTKITLGQ